MEVKMEVKEEAKHCVPDNTISCRTELSSFLTSMNHQVDEVNEAY